ncbi:uncharacterized threonine-rich GPI-anchored glycoprotein PJ4664.02-like isoform X2 [Cotesia glomerata]|uniref:uncharacterized threonine-rich GPI-anchored glycoprotein PJ4664.02-like isoform X2 n=1 Tax=Cotesia glomerata TaxID=32391 RepID=UPI001D00B24C|nr:uncharacterized threonine-rich GPI-anchored glycoprotein PJ4664.02-like isoform X2 [Cotesia glomerata]
MSTVSKVIISVPRFFLVNRQLLFTTMLFYLFVILFASGLAQAAPTESTITDLKGVIEELTTLRPSTVNETVYSDAKASQALGSPLESAGTSRNVSREIITGSPEASRATNITDTDTIIPVDTVTPVAEPIVSTLKTNVVGETIISTTEIPQASTTTSSITVVGMADELSTGAEITSTMLNSVEDDGVSALTLEFTTEAQVFSTATTPITDDIISTLTRVTTTESFIDSTTLVKSATDESTGTVTPEITTSAPTTETEISSTTTPTTNDEISTLTPEITTESFFVLITPNELTSDGINTTLTPEIITDLQTTESKISSTIAPTVNNEISTLTPKIITESFFISTRSSELTKDGITSTLTPEITTESFFVSKIPIESTTDSTTTTLIPEMITDAPTTETEISITTTPTTNDELSILTPETTTESFFVPTTPIESTTDGITTTLTLETTTDAPTSAFEAINTTLNPSTIGVISASIVETPTTEETAVQTDENTTTAYIFHTSQFVLKHETLEYCNWYQINCNNYLNHQSFCTYLLVGDCNNFKAYQIWPIKQLVRSFTYFPYTFNYQYVYKEQRSYGCNLYRVKCEHYYFVNIKTEHCNHEYVGECSNYQMINVINSSFY